MRTRPTQFNNPGSVELIIRDTHNHNKNAYKEAKKVNKKLYKARLNFHRRHFTEAYLGDTTAPALKKECKISPLWLYHKGSEAVKEKQ